MNNFLKELMTLATELNKAEGFNALIVINDMELLYDKHVAELKNLAIHNVSNFPPELDPIVLAKLEHINSLGKSALYEVVNNIGLDFGDGSKFFEYEHRKNYLKELHEKLLVGEVSLEEYIREYKK